jgi:hypothetical protein
MQILPQVESQGIGMSAGLNSILGQIMKRKQEQDSASQLSQLLGSMGMNVPQGMTSPAAQQMLMQMALQEQQGQQAMQLQRAKPGNPMSTDERLAALLNLKQNGQSTPGIDAEIQQLFAMKKSSTNIYNNMGETGGFKTAEEAISAKDKLPAKLLEQATADIAVNEKTGLYQLKLTPKERVPGDAQTKTVQQHTIFSQLDSAINLWKPGYTGVEALGGLRTMTAPYEKDPSRNAFYQTVQGMQNTLLYMRSGAQINETEYTRLMKELSQVKHSDINAIGGFDRFRNMLVDTMESHNEIAKSQDEKLPFPDIPSRQNEVLEKIKKEKFSGTKWPEYENKKKDNIVVKGGKKWRIIGKDKTGKTVVEEVK